MLYLKTSCFLYGGISLAYPIIRAGLEYDKQNNFGKLFLEFQWDSFHFAVYNYRQVKMNASV